MIQEQFFYEALRTPEGVIVTPGVIRRKKHVVSRSSFLVKHASAISDVIILLIVILSFLLVIIK